MERVLYALALLLALAVRLYRLGAAPLTDGEATWALQAWELARGSPDPNWVMGSQAAYVTLSGFLMALLGNSAFWARFWPALLGASLAWLPYFYRDRLGRAAALLLAFALALDPAAVTLARQIDSPIMALTLTLWGLTALRLRQPIWAGLAWGTAALSGPAFWHGLLILGLAALLHWAFQFQQLAAGPLRWSEVRKFAAARLPALERPFVRKAVLAGLAAWLGAGGAFLLEPQGLTTPFSALAEYLESWSLTAASGAPLLRLLGALLAFEAFPLLLALFHLARQPDEQAREEVETPPSPPEAAASPQAEAGASFFGFWLLSGLLLTLLWPGRQTADLLWSVIPLWILACQELRRYLPGRPLPWISTVQAILIALLAIMLWNALISTGRMANLPMLGPVGLQLALVLGIAALAALTTLLVSLGWSWEASRYGLAWGLSATLSLYTLSAMWGAAHLRPHQPVELWSASSGGLQQELFQQTLHDLSSWNVRMPGYLQIYSTVNAPSLRWALRNQANAHFAAQLPAGERPDIVITAAEAPQLAAAYRGQDFVWWLQPAWTGALPPDLFGWLTFRQAPTENVKLILWARSDLFPGGSALTPGLPTGSEPVEVEPPQEMK